MPDAAEAMYPGGPMTQAGNQIRNLEAADTAMSLSPQEYSFYKRHLSNLYGPGGVRNQDGSISTLKQMTVEIGGKTYSLPTVWDGKILEPDEAVKRARQEGLDKFPSYDNEEEAQSRYDQMHEFMEKDTAGVLGVSK